MDVAGIQDTSLADLVADLMSYALRTVWVLVFPFSLVYESDQMGQAASGVAVP